MIVLLAMLFPNLESLFLHCDDGSLIAHPPLLRALTSVTVRDRDWLTQATPMLGRARHLGLAAAVGFSMATLLSNLPWTSELRFPKSGEKCSAEACRDTVHDVAACIGALPGLVTIDCRPPLFGSAAPSMLPILLASSRSVAH